MGPPAYPDASISLSRVVGPARLEASSIKV
jgi:hypothetical protein